MKNVDFIGLPGTGKTTIFVEMAKKRGIMDEWITPDEAIIKIAISQLSKKNKSMKDWFKFLLLRYGFSKRFHQYIANQSINISTTSNHLNECKEISALLHNYIQESKDNTLLKVKRGGWLISQIEEMELIKSNELIDTLIFDESLTQKGFTYLLCKDKEYFNNHLTSLPLPDAFVYFYCNFDVILTRLSNRERLPLQYEFLNNQEIRGRMKLQSNYMERGVAAFFQLGVPGLKINTSHPIGKNVDMINKFVRNLK